VQRRLDGAAIGPRALEQVLERTVGDPTAQQQPSGEPVPTFVGFGLDTAEGASAFVPGDVHVGASGEHDSVDCGQHVKVMEDCDCKRATAKLGGLGPRRHSRKIPKYDEELEAPNG
jgi:hypothetical protein